MKLNRIIASIRNYMLFGMLVVIRPPDILDGDLVPGGSFVMRNPWMVEPDTIIVQENRNVFRVISSEVNKLIRGEGDEYNVEVAIFRHMNSFGYPYTSGPCFLKLRAKDVKLLDQWIKLPMDKKSLVVVEQDEFFEECFDKFKVGACNKYKAYFYKGDHPWFIITYRAVPGTDPFINVRPTRIVNWSFEYAKDLVMVKVKDVLKDREKDLMFTAEASEVGSILDRYMYKINAAKYGHKFAPKFSPRFRR